MAKTVLQISWRRRIIDHFMTGVAVLTVVLVLLPLGAIFAYLIYKGAGSINWAFLTQTPNLWANPAVGWPMQSWDPW